MPTLSLWTRTALLASAGLALPTLFACLDHPLKPVELDTASTKKDSIGLTINKDVDILFVIDNSGSMGEEQGNVSANFETFISVLEAEGVDANYRIGVTTTDTGNPLCEGNGVSPQDGKLRAVSCTERLGEFTFRGTETIVREEACTDYCSSAIQTTDSKPWIESIEDETNLPDGVTATDAFQCFGPQGINGCGMESHLQSMQRFFDRANSPTEPEFGFVRPQAILAIVFVTDEVDCSYNPNFASVFDNDVPNDFWEEGATRATSAICWNAGVECTGGPGTYTECHSANTGVDGAVGVSADAAVLKPVEGYISFIQQQEEQKKAIDANQEVIVAVIGGVPSGYHAGAADIVYQTASEMEDQQSFGIGFGCNAGESARAIPPVRLREFAEAFAVDGERNLFSVCDSSFGPALDEIAKRIADQVKPACMPECVRDVDLTTPGTLEPECSLTQDVPAGAGGDGSVTSGPIDECLYLCGGVECDRSTADEIAIPEGKNVCFNMLTDTTGGETSGSIDNMSDACREEGYNLEFEILRQGGAPPGTTVSAACLLSENETIDCPNLN